MSAEQPAPRPGKHRRGLLILLLALLAGGGAAVGFWFYRQRTSLPVQGSPRYEEYVEAFYVGTAALDVAKTDDNTIEENLTRAVGLVPAEPAAWINRAIHYLRSQQLDQAAQDLERARRLLPDSAVRERAELVALGAYLAERRGKIDEAVSQMRHAVEMDPDDPRKLFKLGQLVKQQGKEDSEAEYQRLMERILALRPDNLKALSELARTAAQRRDAKAFARCLERFGQLSKGWDAKTRGMLKKVEAVSARGPSPAVIRPLFEFTNVIMAAPGFARHREVVDPRDNMVGTPVYRFLRMAPPRATPAEPDLGLSYSAGQRIGKGVPGIASGRWSVVLPVWLTGKGTPAVFVANGKEVRRADREGPVLAFPGGPKSVLPSPDGVVAFDWNNDFRMDILCAGAGGLRFYQQGAGGKFTDVTAKTRLPKSVLEGDYYGAWAADIDSDADLDIILARRKGAPLLLRNNLDGTFTPQPIFPGVTNARAFVWADLDNDGSPDAALLDDAGRLHVFANERSGTFRKWPAKPPAGAFLALTVADVNDDGVFDLVALRKDGVLYRISDKDRRQGWDVGELPPGESVDKGLATGAVRLFAEDLDNNGAIDLLASWGEGGKAWLADGKGGFTPLPASIPPRVQGVADFNGDGLLDLLGLSAEGQPVRYLARGTRDYHWQDLAPSATRATGDDRINSFAIGGEVEVRAGTQVVKQPINRPVIHTGLGSRSRADLIRIQWPNGTYQYEFKKPADSLVVAEQRLKGSCPFLFAWDGEKMVFVTDFAWSTPLGMYINAQDKGGFLQTTDWVRIRSDQLRPRGGHYDLRVQANLWETHYLDYLSLIAVDHPPDTEVFVDERFFLTPTTPQVYLTGSPKPAARAWDHKGKDVTDIVRKIDGRYLDHAGLGRYQGITRDHWVEVDLGADAPRRGPVYLLAHGFVYPTDSSINFAIEQGKHARPGGLVLEVPDGKGGWKVGRDKLGFPAGKNKTVVIRLDGIEGKGVTRRFRLRTNMEIYWDALLYARGLDPSRCVQHRLKASKADLRFRGILGMTQAGRTAPSLPHYDRVICRGQYWRDLTGYYTRFGDVRELLKKVDDRYVIMNAGDEIAFRFPVPPGPPEGWRRTFAWVSDGWVKDGDLNTRFGNTVLPLPWHGMKRYDTPPGRLEDDPVYRRFPRDWDRFHTRYVTPRLFERGLRPLR
jgi:Tfp pilus assembly protein PilF